MVASVRDDAVKDEKPLTLWKRVPCVTCDAKPGESCGTGMLGMPWQWIRTAPHAARLRAGKLEGDRGKEQG